MPARHPASLTADELLRDCDVRRERRSGPGGQHRNKVETAVVLMHRPTGITAEANERRSQVENKDQALRRLRLKLAVEVRSPIDQRPDCPSELWQSRSSDGRISISTSHDDFATLLAEALDTVEAEAFDVAAAARWLGISPSQLAGLLRREPPAWRLVNDARRGRGLRPLN